jgi:hypothetical protein
MLYRGALAPIALEGLENQLDPGVERNEFVRAGADRGLSVALVANLLHVFFGHNPARAACARIEGQKIGPWLGELEADMTGIGCFDRRHPLLHQRMIGAMIALEREADVLGGHRLAIVELDAVAQDEIPGKAVLGHRPGFGQVRRHRRAGHRLHHRVVQRVKHHERRDQRLRLGRIEPSRRQ